MDRSGIERSVNLGWMDWDLKKTAIGLALAKQYGGRIITFGVMDYLFEKISETGFERKLRSAVRVMAGMGVKGIKVYKTLGLSFKDRKGNLVRVNDERIFPLWQEAGRLKLPVLIHAADPQSFWQPPDKKNFWEAVLGQKHYQVWSYYRKGYPSRDELLAERDDVLKLFPKTRFIGAHFGSIDENIDALTTVLDRFPNFSMDISARIPDIVQTKAQEQRAREFMVQYADRIVFGTDLIYDSASVNTGVQSQTFLLPKEAGIGGLSKEEAYIKTSVDFVMSHVDFLETGKAQKNPPFKRVKGSYSIKGLKLPPKTLKSIYRKNIHKLI